MKRRITLVHGTFARGAAWARPGSQLWEALRLAYPDVTIQTFEWSGFNYHNARIKAGLELSAFLVATSEANGGVKHSLVCHSHGGNVALYALRNPRAAGLIQEISFLGTPFIECNVRDIRSSLEMIARFGTWLLLFPIYMPTIGM